MFSPKNVRMPVVHLLIDLTYNIFDIKEMFFLTYLSDKNNVEQKIAQLFLEHLCIIFFYGFNRFVDLLQQKRFE